MAKAAKAVLTCRHCAEPSDEAIQGLHVTPWIASTPLRGASQ
jgi:hypothetical protein